MKRHLLLITSTTLIAGLLNSQVLVSEDFESYEAGSYLVESAGAPWATWDNAPGTTQDVLISNDQAYSGNNSAIFTSANPGDGGPGDILLLLGNQNTGVYHIEWMMYIPSGHGAYFNIQQDETPGQWGLDVTFRSNGSIEFTTDSTTTTTATFPHDEWFEVSMVINLNVSLGSLYINEDGPLIWDLATTVNGDPGIAQLGAINFYTYAGGDPVHFYIDDVVATDQSLVGVEENPTGRILLYPNPVSDILTVELTEANGSTLISVADVTGRMVIDGRTFLQQGSPARTQLDLGALPQGIYMVRIQDGMHETVYPVVRN
jgi:hypothetical protein